MENCSDYVRYASWRFITGYVESEGRQPTGVLFNKFMTLLHRNLKVRHGVDIRLPHCWYRWGDEVVRHGMSYLQWDHVEPGETRVSFRDPVQDIDGDDSVVKLIDPFVEHFIARYSGEEGAEMAVDEVYAAAPFEFQNRFRMLRESLRISRTNLVAVNQTDVIDSLFENAMGCFPHDEFPEVSPYAVQFSAVFKAALDSGVYVRELQEIAEYFWFYFCYHLRLHDRCHENVSVQTLGVWADAIPAETTDYERTIQNQAYLVDPEGSSGDVVRALLLERERRISAVYELLDRMGDGEE